MRNPNQPGCALHTETSLFLPQDANAERKKAGDLDSARTASARHLNATTDYSLSHDDDEREAEGANLAGINPGLFSYSTLKRATRALSLSLSSSSVFLVVFFLFSHLGARRRLLLRESKLFAGSGFNFYLNSRRRRRTDVESPRAILIGADR
jgi:hypothetical protein